VKKYHKLGRKNDKHIEKIFQTNSSKQYLTENNTIAGERLFTCIGPGVILGHGGDVIARVISVTGSEQERVIS